MNCPKCGFNLAESETARRYPATAIAFCTCPACSTIFVDPMVLEPRSTTEDSEAEAQSRITYRKLED